MPFRVAIRNNRWVRAAGQTIKVLDLTTRNFLVLALVQRLYPLINHNQVIPAHCAFPTIVIILDLQHFLLEALNIFPTSRSRAPSLKLANATLYGPLIASVAAAMAAVPQSPIIINSVITAQGFVPFVVSETLRWPDRLADRYADCVGDKKQMQIRDMRSKWNTPRAWEIFCDLFPLIVINLAVTGSITTLPFFTNEEMAIDLSQAILAAGLLLLHLVTMIKIERNILPMPAEKSLDLERGARNPEEETARLLGHDTDSEEASSLRGSLRKSGDEIKSTRSSLDGQPEDLRNPKAGNPLSDLFEQQVSDAASASPPPAAANGKSTRRSGEKSTRLAPIGQASVEDPAGPQQKM